MQRRPGQAHRDTRAIAADLENDLSEALFLISVFAEGATAGNPIVLILIPDMLRSLKHLIIDLHEFIQSHAHHDDVSEFREGLDFDEANATQPSSESDAARESRREDSVTDLQIQLLFHGFLMRPLFPFEPIESTFIPTMPSIDMMIEQTKKDLREQAEREAHLNSVLTLRLVEMLVVSESYQTMNKLMSEILVKMFDQNETALVPIQHQSVYLNGSANYATNFRQSFFAFRGNNTAQSLRKTYSKQTQRDYIDTFIGRYGDCYSILGIEADASLIEINKAYRKLVLIHHPDKHLTSESAEFQKVNEARNILITPQLKSLHDGFLANVQVKKPGMSVR